MVSFHQLKVGNQIIIFKLTYRDQKRLILRFRDGQILISAPHKTSLKIINQFVSRNFAKIVQLQDNYQRYKKISFQSPSWINIFNHPIPIKFSSKSTKTRFLNNELIIYNPGTQMALLKKIYNFLARYYKDWFWLRTEYWAQILDIEFKNLTLRKMVSKWGVCYPTEKKIVYNTRLIHYSQDVIDYVIVHELVHLIHPNHSQKFWTTVQQYLPDYRQLKMSLKF